MVGYSFVIITDERSPEKTAAEIESIHALGMPAYEILVVKDRDRTGKLGKLRNTGCRQAKYNHIIVVDDDMLFHGDFYEGLQVYGEDYDLMSCRILNPDGTRYWDWKAHQNGKNWLLDYDQESPLVSLTGGLTIMKSWVLGVVQWDENLGFYQGEDVDFSNKVKMAGLRIKFNPHATVTHDDPRYTQQGQGVKKLWQLAPA